MRPYHTIQRAALLTELTTHTLRAWERRYAALTPQRTASNRRLYSDGDIERLVLLRKAIQSGQSIGRIAGLPTEDLRRLVAEDTMPASVGPAASTLLMPPFLDEGRHAIEQFDAVALERFLTRSASSLGLVALIDQIVIPLLTHLGEGWRDGSVRIANEHMASAVIRAHLLRTFHTFQPLRSAPCLIVTTPAGQHHEFGALLAAVTAAIEGWRVLYLGTNLPAVEIAGAVQRSGAIAVALSIVYPPDDPGLPEELLTLRRSLGEAVPIIVSGRDSMAYRLALAAINAVIPSGLHGLRLELEAIRAR